MGEGKEKEKERAIDPEGKRGNLLLRRVLFAGRQVAPRIPPPSLPATCGGCGGSATDTRCGSAGAAGADGPTSASSGSRAGQCESEERGGAAVAAAAAGAKACAAGLDFSQLGTARLLLIKLRKLSSGHTVRRER